MITNETRTSIKKIYGLIWDVLALYEKTEMYNKLPEDEESNLKYSETRIFQNELLNTLTLVFQNDFKEYL